jgi:hypothetical protein
MSRMTLRGVLWLLVRLWAVAVLVGLAVASVLAVTDTGSLGPEVGLWVGLAGFLVVALGMLVLVQVTRTDGP